VAVRVAGGGVRVHDGHADDHRHQRHADHRSVIAYTGNQNGGNAGTDLHASNWAAGSVGFRFTGGGNTCGINWTNAGTTSAGGGGPTLSNNILYWHELDGTMTFSAPTTITMFGHVTAGDSFTVQPYSYMQLTPQ